MSLKITLNALLFCVITLNSIGQTTELNWAYNQGGTSTDYLTDIAVASNGDLISTGSFRSTTQFGKANKVSLTAVGSSDIFIHKTDSAGNTLWVKSYGESSTNQATAVALDNDGNIYCTGYFSGSIDFNDDNISDLTAKSYTDIFILKIDKDGTTVWVKSIVGSSSTLCKGLGIAVDKDGNVYSTGFYVNSIDVDGDNNNDFTALASQDAYLHKLDKDGNFVWAKTIGGSSSEYGTAVAVDKGGNVYLTGYFYGTTDFDGDGNIDFTAVSGKDGFIQKWSPAGNSIWIKQLGGSSGSSSDDIAVDANGNVYSTGYFEGTADFSNSGGADLTSKGGYDAFITKFDTDGNYKWANQFGGPGYDGANSVAVDHLGNVFCTGYFKDSVDYDNNGTYDFSSIAYKDIFVYQVDSSGNTNWAAAYGSSNNDEGTSITIDSLGMLSVAGTHSTTLGFGTGINDTVTTNGGQDIIIFKYSVEYPIVTSKFSLESSSLNLYPNPASDIIRIKSDREIDLILIVDNQGKIILESTEDEIVVNNLKAGLYFVRLQLKNGQNLVEKLVKK